MLFNRHTMQNTSVFIFAHQDDEFGIYPEIERLINNQTKVIIFYLTSGSLDGKPRQDRNAESSNVLKDIGTVSYTHLRAHETLMNLVCRLLLEKSQ